MLNIQNISRENLIKLVIEWGDIKEASKLLSEVRKVSGIFKCNFTESSNLSIGDVVLVKLEKDNYCKYARVLDVHSDSNIRVSFNPNSLDDIVTISSEFIYTLNSEFKKILREGDSININKMIKDPVDLLYERVMEQTKLMVNNFLVNNHSIPNSDVIERWNENNIDIKDISLVIYILCMFVLNM